MSGAWLASRLDRGQNELIHDSKPSCFFLEPCTRLWTQEPAGVRMRAGVSVKAFPEAPAATDHWQPAAPSAPAQQHGLRPPLFPMERPSLFWTHASTEQQGA
ncbi:Major capsid protein L1 [Dissostichus eleginoides]|uniref:Major capsid protein L1 n=1 Tax=Dissostichus eleginoides TaxID=100907 RepID=A0AAD9B4G7_DISEL|nr:Major capsid protein L1 [Dissostichus eleginoides]